MDWNGDEFLTQVEREYSLRVGAAANRVADRMRSLISGPPHPPGHKAPAGAPPGTLSGDLLGSIVVVHDGLEAKAGSTDYTAQWLEFGTEDMPAHSFVRRALAESQSEIEDIINNGTGS